MVREEGSLGRTAMEGASVDDLLSGDLLDAEPSGGCGMDF